MAGEISFKRNLINRVSKIGVFTVPKNAYTFDKLTDMDKKFCRKIEMENDVTYIGEGFAQDAKSVRTVELSDEISRIPNNAFLNCVKLKNINIPENLKEIGDFAFQKTKIKEVSLSKDFEQVGNGAFLNCKKLKNLTIDIENENMQKIGIDAFAGCKKLKSFVIPETVKEIGAGSFAGCRKIKKLNIPVECTSIEGNPFVSSTIAKENGKMSLRDRLCAFRAKMYIEGMEPNPIKARKFEKMTTGFKGERLIWANGQVYCERKDGKFDVMSPETYAENSKDELQKAIKETVITPEAFCAYMKENHSADFDVEMVRQKQDIFNTDKPAIKVAVNNKTIEINLDELKQYAYNNEQEEINKDLRVQFNEQREELGREKTEKRVKQAEEERLEEEQKQKDKEARQQELKDKRDAENEARRANAEKVKQENIEKINAHNQQVKEEREEKRQAKANRKAEKKAQKDKKELEKNIKDAPEWRQVAMLRAFDNEQKFKEQNPNKTAETNRQQDTPTYETEQSIEIEQVPATPTSSGDIPQYDMNNFQQNFDNGYVLEGDIYAQQGIEQTPIEQTQTPEQSKEKDGLTK